MQILVVGVDELTAELAEHALVEIVVGEHASTPTIARLVHDRRRASGLQTIGGGQSGNAAADDSDRPLGRLLFGVSAPVQDRRQRRGASGGSGYPQQSPPCQSGRSRHNQRIITDRKSQSFFDGGE